MSPWAWFFAVHAATVEAACNIINGQAYGDCGNVRVNTDPPAFLDVLTNRSASGIIAGATVHPSAGLTLTGISNGNITVLAGGSLDVQGIVNATVINEGGAVRIGGTVTALRMQGGNAIIAGVVYSLTGTGNVVCEVGAYVNGRVSAGGAC
ncbi:MAG: hypothetical protein KIS68_12690 [Bauldia sp.]|nr:hypothetical protein [Bauldia sp.]